MSIIEKRHQQQLQKRNAAVWPAHYNAGTRIHLVGSGSKAEEPWAVEKCACGAGFVEHSDLLAHIREGNEQAGAMDENEWDSRSNT